MLSMGVPESLLRRLEEEQLAVKALDARKKRENARKTHRRLTIVAGKLGKRKLLSPSGLDTRPMMGMVRGATFDMLMSLVGSRSNVQFPDPGARWLDLFAGTGAIGLEALSRGAAEAHFVEMDPWVSSNVLNKNIKTLGVGARCTTHVAKVETFLERHELSAKAAGGAFDFVSFCPPYYKVSYPDLLAKLDASPLLSAETLVIVEYARSRDEGGDREEASAAAGSTCGSGSSWGPDSGDAGRGRRVGGAAGGGDEVREGREGRGEGGRVRGRRGGVLMAAGTNDRERRELDLASSRR